MSEPLPVATILDELFGDPAFQAPKFEVTCQVCPGIRTLIGWVFDEKCGKPANTLVICKGCGWRSYTCEKHLANTAEASMVRCGRCKAEGLSAETFDYIPIGRT